MKSTFIQLFALSVLIFGQVQAQENDSVAEVKTTDNWDNFRERDASIYYFTFCMPEAYVTSVKSTRDSKILSQASTRTDFDAARYQVYQILEEELGKETNKKFVVADPDQEDKSFKAYCPPCSTSGGKYGFSQLPGWMFKRFLKYDEEVGYLVKLSVDIDDKVGMSSDVIPEKLKPKCTINMTFYDRDKNKIGNYKYTKKDFDKIRIKSSENIVFDHLLNTDWNVKETKGLSLPDVMSIYVQTLQEMMMNTEIILP